MARAYAVWSVLLGVAALGFVAPRLPKAERKELNATRLGAKQKEFERTSLPSWTAWTTGILAVLGGARHARAESKRQGSQRREALLAAGAPFLMPQAASAQYQMEDRIAYFREKARVLNFAADWYLFDVKPLVHPTENVVSEEMCKELGASCPDFKALGSLREMYKGNVSQNAGAGASISTFERNVLYPMKDVSLCNAVDPDTSEELQQIFQKFELNQYQLGKAARQDDMPTARTKFDEGRLLMNEFFTKVDDSVGLKAGDEIYFAPIPVDNKATETDKYWMRRGKKWEVKKKVDTLSKSNKTARFYAKSIFGEDAEGLSWDVRGDRAESFYSGS